MAIFIPGMKCQLCGEPISGDQRRRLFAPFVRNANDPLYVFSDATVHAKCFDLDPRSASVDRIRTLGLDANKRPCVVCDKEVAPKERYATGYVTSDPADPAYEYNYLCFHKTHLHEWEHWQEFRRRVLELQASNRWNGPPILDQSLETSA